MGVISLHSAAPCLKICCLGKADKVVYLCCRSAAASAFAFKQISFRGDSPERELLQRQSVMFCPYTRCLVFPGCLRTQEDFNTTNTRTIPKASEILRKLYMYQSGCPLSTRSSCGLWPFNCGLVPYAPTLCSETPCGRK